MNDLLMLYGLKYNPFLPDVPPEDLWRPPGFDAFLGRLRDLLARGGFALLSGDPGRGKSKILQLLTTELARQPELAIGVMERPQNRLGDFYRELGDLFAVDLSPVNRYGGFKALRARWRSHLKTTLFRPVLLIDEGQEVSDDCLTELRLLASAHFDSESLLSVVLADDSRLGDRLQSRALLPLGSRIRTRWLLEPLSTKDLRDFLDVALERAGAPHLMSDELKYVLCEHALGNLRVLCNTAAELLAVAAQRQIATLDDDLFFDVFPHTVRGRRPASSAARRNKE